MRDSQFNFFGNKRGTRTGFARIPEQRRSLWDRSVMLGLETQTLK
jgi:hypothetical protein